MFTGIITAKGQVDQLQWLTDSSISEQPLSLQLQVRHAYDHLVPGESVAVNGVCLTVIPIDQHLFRCDVSKETLHCTNLNKLQQNEMLNLERALRLSDRLGGHFVQGHVDQSARVESIESTDDWVELTIAGVNEVNQAYLYSKASIAVNGVSLTVNSVSDDHFNVMLIPETCKRTTLGDLKVNDTVNLEFDMLAKCVHRQLSIKAQNI